MAIREMQIKIIFGFRGIAVIRTTSDSGVDVDEREPIGTAWDGN